MDTLIGAMDVASALFGFPNVLISKTFTYLEPTKVDGEIVVHHQIVLLAANEILFQNIMLTKHVGERGRNGR